MAKDNATKEKKPFYKKWWFIALVVLVVLWAIGSIFGDDTTEVADKPAEETEAVEETTTEEETEAVEETEKEKTEYGLNDPWVVDGQWELTVTGVRVTEDRNQFSEKDPAEVVIVEYTYTNTGYEADMQDLYLTPDRIMDATGKMGYTYPASTEKTVQPTPEGGTTEGETAFGLDNASDTVKVYFEKYDNDGNNQKAVFNVEVTK